MKQIIFTEDLDKIINDHINGYNHKDGDISYREHFIDIFKKKVVITLWINEEGE